MRRFSLIELVIAVALMMTLAALALPHAHRATLEAKRAEAYTNVDGLMTALQARYSAGELDEAHLTPPRHPRAIADLDGSTASWYPIPTEWSQMAWEPAGDVRCSYTGDFAVSSTTLGATALCDIDENGIYFAYGSSLPIDGSATHNGSDCWNFGWGNPVETCF